MNEYRGKRLDNGQWVYGWYVRDAWHPDGTESAWIYEETGGGGGHAIHVVDRETVSQHSGLGDRKRTDDFPFGQQIYAGDVVKSVGDYIYVVKFYRGSFSLCHRDSRFAMDLRCSREKDLEVIGNKWDNPDLLRGDQ